MNKLNLIVGSFVFFIIFPLNGMGADFNVSTPVLFQAALDTAIDNNEADTIYVAPGTYTLTSTLTYSLTPETNDETYSLTIVGGGADITVLNGNHARQVMMINCISENFGVGPSDENCDISISGLTFENGNSDYAGGLEFTAWEADLTVENCKFVHNEGDYGSGGLSADTKANVTLTGNSFESNTTYYSGAGAYVTAGYNSGGTARIENNIFKENHGLDSDDYGGGGAYVFGDNLIITGNTFQDNKLDAYYTLGGAGLCAIATVSADVSNNTFTNNDILSDSTYGPGGAYIGAYSAFTTPVTLTVTGNQFDNNVGIHGGGARVDFKTSLTFSKNIFENNSAITDAGGAHIHSTSNGTAKIVNNVFVNNEANGSYANAGGLYLETNDYPSTTVFTNNTFTLNTVTGDGGEYYGKGGGIYLKTIHNDTSVSLYNNIIWGNSAVEEGDDIYILDDMYPIFGGDGTGAIINMYNNDFSESFVFDGDHLFQENNINSNPNFVDAVNNDIHLQGNSPCIEAGYDSAPDIPATDYDDDTRIINDHVDIGADEYDGLPIPSVQKGDVNDDKNVDLTDVILSLQLLTGQNLSQPIYVEADADNDNKIGISDVIYVLIETSQSP